MIKDKLNVSSNERKKNVKHLEPNHLSYEDRSYALRHAMEFMVIQILVSNFIEYFGSFVPWDESCRRDILK